MFTRFLSPSQNSSFYGGRRHPPPPEPRLESLSLAGVHNGDASTYSLLESISYSLSGVHSQLSTIQEQNLERDATMKKVLQELDDLKNKTYADGDGTPKLNRSRKSPRGLSVSMMYTGSV